MYLSLLNRPNFNVEFFFFYNFLTYRKTPLLVLGVCQFSNAISFQFNYLIILFKTRFNRGLDVGSEIFLDSSIRWSISKLLGLENGPTPGTKSGVFR